MIYSHSRLSSFEQCPFKFKLRYIDKIKPEVETSIEAHLGSSVHDILEWLYKEVQKNNFPTIEETINCYSTTWREKYHPNTLFVRKHLTEKDYFNKGITFLLNYYTKHKPFQDGTLEIEKRIFIDLNHDKKYRLQGFIDRFVHNKENNCYEIHDYKTGNFLPSQEKFDKDRQLALYSIGIKEVFGYDKDVHLIWHYLAHNKKILSKRTNQQLEELKSQTIFLIDEIESTTDFPAQKSQLCDWCEYKGMCPMFGGIIGEKQKNLEHFEKQGLTKQEEEKELDIWS
jgi:putative RecB family exonuclease